VLVIAAVVAGGAVSPRALPKVIVGILVIASVGYFAAMLLGPQVQSVERARLRAFVPLCIGNAASWSLFSQVFTTLTAYSKEWMDGSCLGSIANPARISSMEPIWTLPLSPLSPLFAVSWTKLGERALRTPRKFAGGGTGMGGAFLLFLTMAGGTGRSGPVLAVSGLLALIAVSKLLLSPIGLSVATELAPGVLPRPAVLARARVRLLRRERRHRDRFDPGGWRCGTGWRACTDRVALTGRSALQWRGWAYSPPEGAGAVETESECGSGSRWGTTRPTTRGRRAGSRTPGSTRCPPASICSSTARPRTPLSRWRQLPAPPGAFDCCPR
jgi:hypothetical protein